VTYLLIGLALCMIIGPAFMLLPSKRQREQMTLRRRASTEGLQVELSRIDDPDPEPGKYISLTGKPLDPILKCIAYRMPRKRIRDWRKQPVVNWKIAKKPGARNDSLPADWEWLETTSEKLPEQLKSAIREGLQQLPADVVVVEEKNYQVSIFWHERGGEAGLAAMIHFLKTVVSTPLIEPEEDDSAV